MIRKFETLAIPLALFSALALAAPVGDSHKGAQRSANEKEISLIRDEMQESLVDADSAKFRKVFVVDAEHFGRACGLVNPKNKLGAYIGYKPFAATLFNKRDGTYTFAGLVWLPNDDDDIQAIVEYCENNQGVKIPP